MSAIAAGRRLGPITAISYDAVVGRDLRDRAPTALRWFVLCAALLGCILLPFFLFGAYLEQAATNAVATASSRWMVATMIAAFLASDVLLPVPSSALSTAAGALLGPWTGSLASFCGMTLGSAFAYWLGASVGYRALNTLITPRELARVEAGNRRLGMLALLFLRPVPVLAEASVLWAGATLMPKMRFWLVVSAGNLTISIAYAVLGAHAIGQ